MDGGLPRHDWLLVTAPNGDLGFVCRRCQMTALRLPVPAIVSSCPCAQPDYDAVMAALAKERRRRRSG